MSHPVWVRGLKLPPVPALAGLASSHPVWVRGLKQDEANLRNAQDRRTPCGCVD